MTPGPRQGLIGIAGLLLTPFVAWAASFLGGWLGASAGSLVEGDRAALWIMVASSVLAAVVATITWLRFLYRFRKKLSGKANGSDAQRMNE